MCFVWLVGWFTLFLFFGWVTVWIVCLFIDIVGVVGAVGGGGVV